MNEELKLGKHIQAAVNNLERQITKLRAEREKEKVKIEQATQSFEALDIAISKLHDNIHALKNSPQV